MPDQQTVPEGTWARNKSERLGKFVFDFWRELPDQPISTIMLEGHPLESVPKKLKPDLFTFVAGVAAERNEPLPITCNCGGVITIMPPIQQNLVVCARCESRIKIFVLGANMGTDGTNPGLSRP